MSILETTTEDCVARFHEITDKWIREHRQEYRGNRYCTVLYCTVLYCNVPRHRSGDLQDAYLDKINAGEEHFSAEVCI